MDFGLELSKEYRIPPDVGVESPNAETVEAIKEVERMKADVSLGKTYTDTDQMLEELLASV